MNRNDLCNWLLSGLAEQRRIDRALAQNESAPSNAVPDKSGIAPSQPDPFQESDIIILHRPDDEKKNKRHNKVSVSDFIRCLTKRTRCSLSTLTKSETLSFPPEFLGYQSLALKFLRTTLRKLHRIRTA